MYPDLALYVGGEWKNGGSRKGEDVINPATEKPLARLPHASTADLDQALAAATKGFEVWRVTQTVDLDLERSFVRCILVMVDGVAHLPEIAAKLTLFLAFDLEAGNRNRCRGEDRNNSNGDDKFDKGQPSLGMPISGSNQPRRCDRRVRTTRICCSPHFTCTTACEPTAGRFA